MNIIKFRQASFDLLTDFLVNINKENKDTLDSLSKCSGCFKNANVMEYIFHITRALDLDPQVGYHATELLQRFMTTHLTKQLTIPSPQGASGIQPISVEDSVLDSLKTKFPDIVFSCVQLASKMSLHVIDNNTAIRFLHSLGYTATKKTLLDSELLVLKGLDYKLAVTNPLIYVEILLEVLVHNEPSIPIERTYGLCQQVLQFVVLERATIFDSLLMVTIRSKQPTTEQRSLSAVSTSNSIGGGDSSLRQQPFILQLHQGDLKAFIGHKTLLGQSWISSRFLPAVGCCWTADYRSIQHVAPPPSLKARSGEILLSTHGLSVV
uniref:Uncharacterized protein n=1 Tax=Knipowitschia caucasica TaxID=637954 RepID=A0AAV2LFM0_KNICA